VRPETRNKKPGTKNPKQETRNSRQETRNPKQETRNQKPKISMTIKRFEELEIWQLARELNKDVLRISNIEPFTKDFRFRDQIRASSGSIMDNIAEGFERDGRKEFIQFLSISKGSLGETRSQFYRAFDSDYIRETELNELLIKTDLLGQKLGNFMNYLKKSQLSGSKYK
jgi:four helix bundle protein